MDFFKLF